MKNEIHAAAQARVVLLAGEEPTMRVRGLQELIAIHEAAGDEFDREQRISSGVDLRDMIGVAGTAPFLSETRVAVLRNVLREEIDEAKVVLGELRSLPETARLVLVADEEAGEKAGRNKKTLAKLVKDAGGMVLEFTVDPKKAVEEIRAEADRRGKKLPAPAAKLLIDMVGGSYSLALEELDKVVLIIGEEATITERDLKEVVIASREYNIFSLIDAVVGKRPGEAMKQLNLIASNKTKANEVLIGNVLPLMARQMRLIYQAKCLTEYGTEAQNDFPEKTHLLKLGDWQRNKPIEVARKLSMAQILELLNLLAEADARAKGMMDAYGEGSEQLESLVLRATLV